MKPLTRTQVERWSDDRLLREIREIYTRLGHYGVKSWVDLPETERRNAYLVRNEHIRRTEQATLF